MIAYTGEFGDGLDKELIFVAENQCWDEATLEELQTKYNIIFMTSGDGVTPIMIVEREREEPLIVIGGEDDGKIFFYKPYGQFTNVLSVYWIPYLVSDLLKAKEIVDLKERLESEQK